MNNHPNGHAAPARTYSLSTSRRSWFKTVLFSATSVAALGCWNTWARGKKGQGRCVHGGLFAKVSGTWGNLECERVVLEPNENSLSITELSKPSRWFFKGFSKSQVRRFLGEAGVTDPLLKLISDSQMSEESAGIVFTPGSEFIRKLTAESRAKIFNTLIANDDYKPYFGLYLFLPEYLDLALQQISLPPASVQLFRALLYKRGNLSAFSDVPVVLESLPDNAAKTVFLKLLVRRPALEVQLKFPDNGNLNDLVDYWATRERTKEVQLAFANAVSANGTRVVDVVDLLPPFAGERVNSFPNSNSQMELVHNCHWTSLNFFSDSPNEGYLFIEEVEKELTANYGKIPAEPRFGDVILFRNEAHEIVHSAVYIADRIVFTKNGEGPTQPWCFMYVTDVIDLYACLFGKMSVKIYRRRST